MIARAKKKKRRRDRNARIAYLAYNGHKQRLLPVQDRRPLVVRLYKNFRWLDGRSGPDHVRLGHDVGRSSVLFHARIVLVRVQGRLDAHNRLNHNLKWRSNNTIKD